MAVRGSFAGLLMLVTMSHAWGCVPSASPRTPLPAACRTALITMSLTETHAVVLTDARGVVVPTTEATGIRLESGVVIVPHPSKETTGGEDASFSRDGYYAVFDGVGGWASKGVDAGVFSRTLAANTANALDMIRSSGYSPETVFEDLEMALEAGLAEIGESMKGSTTACMLSISPDGRVANILNIGDSGFHIFRPSEDDPRAMQLLAKSRTQQHDFNFPFQLSSWAANVQNRDYPSDGDRYTHKLQPGDLILLTSDGVLDNLFDDQIRAILDEVRADGGDICPNIAAVIARHAREASLGTTEVTPWTESLAAAGRDPDDERRGGKVDDVTVLAVKVLARQCEGGESAAAPHAEEMTRDEEPSLEVTRDEEPSLWVGSAEEMAGGVVPTSSFVPPAPEPAGTGVSSYHISEMDAKVAWLAGRRGTLR